MEIRSLATQHASLQVDDWFVSIASGDELSSAARIELAEKGFIIIPGPLGHVGPSKAPSFGATLSRRAHLPVGLMTHSRA